MRLLVSWLRDFVDVTASAEDLADTIGLRGFEVAAIELLNGGDGCSRCKGSGFIEMGGAGRVHPAVFEKVGYDAERYTGFAFGLGIERIAMLKHGIDDIRLFYENDLRFLSQFPG